MRTKKKKTLAARTIFAAALGGLLLSWPVRAGYFVNTRDIIIGNYGGGAANENNPPGIALMNNDLVPLGNNFALPDKQLPEQIVYVKWDVEQTFGEVLLILPDYQQIKGDIEVYLRNDVTDTDTLCATIPQKYSARFPCVGTGTGIILKKDGTALVPTVASKMKLTELRVYQYAHVTPVKPYKYAKSTAGPTGDVTNPAETKMDAWFTPASGVNQYKVNTNENKGTTLQGDADPVYVFNLSQAMEISIISVVCTQYDQSKALDIHCENMEAQVVGAAPAGVLNPSPDSYSGYDQTQCIYTSTRTGGGLDFDCLDYEGENVIIRKKSTGIDLSFSIIDIAIYPSKSYCPDMSSGLTLTPSQLEKAFKVGDSIVIDLESEVTITPAKDSACSDRTWAIDPASVVPFGVVGQDSNGLWTFSASTPLSSSEVGEHSITIKVTDVDSGIEGSFELVIIVCPSAVTLAPQDNAPFEVLQGSEAVSVAYPALDPSTFPETCFTWSITSQSGNVNLQTDDIAKMMTFNDFTVLGSSVFTIGLANNAGDHIDSKSFEILVERCQCAHSQVGEFPVLQDNFFETSSLENLKTVSTLVVDYPFTETECLDPICSFTYSFDALTLTAIPSTLSGVDLIDQAEITVEKDLSSFTLQTAGGMHGTTGTIELKATENNTDILSKQQYTVHLYCHIDATVDILMASNSMTYVEGETPDQLTFTLGGSYSAAPLCWSGLEHTCDVILVSGSSALTIASCDLVSGIGTIQLAELVRVNVGEHTLQVRLSDTKNPAFSSFAELSIIVVNAEEVEAEVEQEVDELSGSLVNEEACDPDLLFLAQASGTTDPLPEKTLEITTGDSSITYNVPLMTIESLDSDPQMATLCGPINYKVVVKDSAGEVLPFQTFATFIASSANRLTIAALSNDDVGDYSLELVSTLANYPTVTSTVELFEVAIFEDPDLDTSQTNNGNTNSSSSGESTDSDAAQSAVVTSNDDKDGDGVGNFNVEFVPRYVLEELPDAPNLGQRTYASVEITEITPLGLMTLRLNETVIQHRMEEYTSLTPVDFEVIYVKNSEEEAQQMTYEITKVGPSEIQVQLTFKNPYLVSQAQISDQILVKMNKDFFLVPSRMALGSTVVIDEDEDPYFLVSDELPKMLGSAEELSTLETIGNSAKIVITVAIVVPLVVGIGLKGVMSKLWAMLNTIQLIDALSIISVSVPANVITVQQYSHSIINFQPIDKDLVYALIFGEDDDGDATPDTVDTASLQLNDTLRLLDDADADADVEDYNGDLASRLDELRLKAPPISQALENFDFSAEALLKGMLLLGLLLAVALVLIALIYFCVKKCMHRCHPTIRKLCLKLKGMLMYNSLLRYFMMIFLQTSIGCCLQIQATTQDPTLLNKIESILSLVILAIFLTLTVVLTRHIFRNIKNLNKPTFKQAFGTLYTPCETGRGKWPLIYLAVFCVRRLLVAIIVSFLPGYPLTQIVCTAIMSHFVLMWHAQVWPMENTRQNIMYFSNEYLYLACCFYTVGFSEYNSDPRVKFSQGWFYLGFIAAILITNVTVLILDIVIGIRDFCRRRKLRKQKDAKIQEETKLKKLVVQRQAVLPNAMEFPALANKRAMMTSQLQIVKEEEDEVSQSDASGRSSKKSKASLKSGSLLNSEAASQRSGQSSSQLLSSRGRSNLSESSFGSSLQKRSVISASSLSEASESQSSFSNSDLLMVSSSSQSSSGLDPYQDYSQNLSQSKSHSQSQGRLDDLTIKYKTSMTSFVKSGGSQEATSKNVFFPNESTEEEKQFTNNQHHHQYLACNSLDLSKIGPLEFATHSPYKRTYDVTPSGVSFRQQIVKTSLTPAAAAAPSSYETVDGDQRARFVPQQSRREPVHASLDQEFWGMRLDNLMNPGEFKKQCDYLAQIDKELTDLENMRQH